MKKIIAILLVAMMALSLVACGEKPAPTPDPDPTTGTYKTGLGMVVSMSGTDAEDEDPAKTQADVTVCEATFDQDGKIVAVSFDVAQCKASVAEGVVTVPENVLTKRELGDDYNMAKYADPAAVGEWYQQAAALEEYCIGKTAAEVAGMPLGPNAHNHTDTPAVEELKTTCTISVTDFLAALTKAYENAKDENTTYAKAGLGMVVSMSGTDAEDEDPAKTQADVTAVAVALDAEGKIVAVSIDVAQCKGSVDAEGVVTVAENTLTKRELGDDYNMAKYADPAAVGEWYQQAAAFEAYCIGKTPAEVAAMELGPNAHNHTDTPAVEELKTTCTISVTDFLAALAKAAENVK